MAVPRKVRLSKTALLRTVADIEAGCRDADLGGGIVKQRIAREGGGKSGGYRVIIVFKVGSDSFFVHGFAKSHAANVTASELKALRKLAGVLLRLSHAEIEVALKAGALVEVRNDGEQTED